MFERTLHFKRPHALQEPTSTVIREILGGQKVHLGFFIRCTRELMAKKTSLAHTDPSPCQPHFEVFTQKKRHRVAHGCSQQLYSPTGGDRNKRTMLTGVNMHQSEKCDVE